MRTGRAGVAVIGAATALALGAGCAGTRFVNGVYHSPKGYRVVIPVAGWSVVESSRADLELRHRSAEAGMLVNAACGRAVARRSPVALAHQLLAGLRDRVVIERGEVSLNGRRATRALLEARSDAAGPPVKIEVYVMREGRCVYDLIYAAPPPVFEAWRADFDRFVDTFVTE